MCSSWVEFDKEVNFLLAYFRDNGYPTHVVYKVLNKYLTSHFKDKVNNFNVSKLKFYCKLPFLNNPASNFIKKDLGKILRMCYPHMDIRFVFSNSRTIQGLVNHKEKNPTFLTSGLVYLYKCGACGATYIGQSKKCLKTRVGEHFGISTRTGEPLVRPPQSSIRDHIEICGSGKSLDDFEYLHTFTNPLLLRICESLEILERKPVLNSEASSYPLHLV